MDHTTLLAGVAATIAIAVALFVFGRDSGTLHVIESEYQESCERYEVDNVLRRSADLPDYAKAVASYASLDQIWDWIESHQPRPPNSGQETNL
jgi:hypothetical protein